MRRVCVCVCLLIFTLSLCSWVDPSTVDVYRGSISFADTSGYDVVHLSGDIQYWLSDYSGLSLSDAGYVVSTKAVSRSGTALIGGVEYPIRFNSLSGLQIEQTYYYGTTLRTVYVNYNLTPASPADVPSGLSLPEVSLLAVTVIVFFVLIFLMLGRDIL